MNKVEVLAAWSNYQKWWSTARDQDILRFQAISWPTVTTVTVAEDLTVNRIASFVLSPHHSQDKSPKDRIKEQLLRWHPDRFDGRYLPKVPAEERDAVRQAVGHVVKALNELISRDRDSPFA
ncbi:hypothetical protein BD410DRAFT_729818 [Rickenella mellea]|uniref:Uncharacterized protein n=1 Tax=Rickenella mellea TaxID=50990 RepID=A0A4Y7PR63_9AGAM|nr:hypothetical protein BD410DRAFT_729818 [Rickenella mellea]